MMGVGRDVKSRDMSMVDETGERREERRGEVL